MKTLHVSDTTIEILQKKKQKENGGPFDNLLVNLIQRVQNRQGALFGSLKGKAKRFTTKERRIIWNEM